MKNSTGQKNMERCTSDATVKCAIATSDERTSRSSESGDQDLGRVIRPNRASMMLSRDCRASVTVVTRSLQHELIQPSLLPPNSAAYFTGTRIPSVVSGGEALAWIHGLPTYIFDTFTSSKKHSIVRSHPATSRIWSH